MDQRTNFYEDDEDSEPETIYIPTIDQGKEILYEEFIDYRLSGLNQNDEKKCRKEIKEAINNQCQSFLIYGVPHAYTRTYLTAVIETLAERVMLPFKEEKTFYNIFTWFTFVNFFAIVYLVFNIHTVDALSGIELLGFEIAGYKISELGMFFGVLIIYVMICPPISFFIAQEIMRGLKSNLLGIRGILMSILMGILLTAFFTPRLFKYVAEKARFDFSALEDDKTSVPIPPQSTEENTTTFSFINHAVIKKHQSALNILKISSPTESGIQGSTHIEGPGEYNR